jgi:hypothetical protein
MGGGRTLAKRTVADGRRCGATKMKGGTCLIWTVADGRRCGATTGAVRTTVTNLGMTGAVRTTVTNHICAREDPRLTGATTDTTSGATSGALAD